MDASLRDDLRGRLEELRAAGLYKGEHVIETPQSAHVGVDRPRRGAEPVRQQLPRPGRPSRHRRGGARGARAVGLRDGVGALHLRHPGGAPRARAAAGGVPGQRGRDPLRLVLRRQRRPLRGAARPRRRGHLRRAQPRLDHRRHPPVQGAPAAVRKRRHGRARGAPRGVGRRPPPPDRDRRRVLDGRLLRQPARDLRPGRAPRRDRDGGRLPRRRLRRRKRPRHATSCTT